MNTGELVELAQQLRYISSILCFHNALRDGER